MPIDKHRTDNVCVLTPSSSSSPSSNGTIGQLSVAFQSHAKIRASSSLTTRHARSLSNPNGATVYHVASSDGGCVRDITQHIADGPERSGNSDMARRRFDLVDNRQRRMSKKENTRERPFPRHRHLSTPTLTTLEDQGVQYTFPSPSLSPKLNGQAHSEKIAASNTKQSCAKEPYEARSLPSIEPTEQAFEMLQTDKMASMQTLTPSPIESSAAAPGLNGQGITSSQLAVMMEDTSNAPLLIDVRSLEDYDKLRIRDSINVNLPTLIVKRYHRGIVSNFNLENFIATQDGRQHYLDWLHRQQQCKKPGHIIVYDDTMAFENQSSLGWILVGVLRMNTESDGYMIDSLDGGFEGFRQWDRSYRHLTGTLGHHQPIPDTTRTAPSTKVWLWADAGPLTPHQDTLKVPHASPMQSRSATTFSSGQLLDPNAPNPQRRASLFSLDTSCMPTKSKSRPEASQQRQPKPDVSGEHQWIGQQDHAFPLPLTDEATNTPRPTASQRDMAPSLTTPAYLDPTPMKEKTGYMDTHGLPSSGENTPATEQEYAFIISEIVPGFLYLGPEISTTEQLEKMQSYSIKRVLNMAEECDDDVPGLKERMTYRKVAARDTVEMLNIEGTLRKAVEVINDAKRSHDPIYVHCKAGKSRSVAAILAYLVLSERWTLKRAYQHVIQARPSMSPNIGFVAELMKLEESIHGKVSNFGSTNWQGMSIRNPPSPDLQRDIGKLAHAWQQSTVEEKGS